MDIAGIIVTSYTASPRMVIALPKLILRAVFILVMTVLTALTYTAATLLEWALLAAAAIYMIMIQRVEGATLATTASQTPMGRVETESIES